MKITSGFFGFKTVWILYTSIIGGNSRKFRIKIFRINS
ncbi:hypothetical protein CHRY9393_01066 [Chryseobacterium fistulae]|uniref:Uncharacterized protein n=1 Tax=Chryseobacterium fistulae TaxID=2675058 RepID=A0A6N4XRJ5_9FLAO|nr:hypothetical protein CHRY9393_01066 [Chryseobacterium fistulae]